MPCPYQKTKDVIVRAIHESPLRIITYQFQANRPFAPPLRGAQFLLAVNAFKNRCGHQGGHYRH